MDTSFIINNLGEEMDNYFNAIAPPIMQTSNYRFNNVADFRKANHNEKEALIYSRGNNPTLQILSKKLAALEGAEDCLLTASGMAAISTAIIANVKKGDHVICQKQPYSWTQKMMNGGFLERFGVEVSLVNGSETTEIQNAIKPNTILIYMESPNSWTYELQDLQEIAQIAKQRSITTIVDGSYATPLNQRPIALGIDIVVHSATKYIGGHSDTVAGVICGSKKILEKLFNHEYLMLGGIISPFNAWLLLRGLRTLPLRMERVAQSTAKVVEFLGNHPKVEKVYYPFLSSNPQYALACKQMKQGSGLLSILTKNKDVKAIENFCNHLKRFSLAVSWGGYESLVFPSCIFATEGSGTSFPSNLIRFSIGLENVDVLIQDLEDGFKYL